MNCEEIRDIINKSPIIRKGELIIISTYWIDVWHKDTPVRKSGKPYGDHPRSIIAYLLELWPLPEYVYGTGGAHDAVEEGADLEQIERVIGRRGKILVEGMTQEKTPKVDSYDARKERKARYHVKFEKYYKRDFHLLPVKLADSLHSLRKIGYLETGRQLRYCDDTEFFLDFYDTHRKSLMKKLTSSQIAVLDGWAREMEEIIKKVRTSQVPVMA